MERILLTATRYEIDLLVFSESDISPGLALSQQIAHECGYDCRVIVVNNSPSGLKEQIKQRLAHAHSADDKTRSGTRFKVDAAELDTEGLVSELNSQKGLRLLLVPGVDQADDTRMSLIREVHATVVCFESHPAFKDPPKCFWVLSEEAERSHESDAKWFADHIVPYPAVTVISKEALTVDSQKETPELTSSDWVVLVADDKNLDAQMKSGKSTVATAVGPVLLVRTEPSWWETLTERQIPALTKRFIPQMERSQRRDLAETLEQHARLDFEFLALICSATFLAAFGLIQNSAAVIIGAMLVAPLMTPILGAGLSLAHGNSPLFWQALRTIVLGFFAALTSSAIFGVIARFLVPAILNFNGDGSLQLTSEMWARTYPTALDFMVGLVGGSAAAFARTRSHLADALAGAAIAAALVPPIATAGLHVAMIGMNIAPPEGKLEATNLITGPVLLFVANALTIMIGSSFVLWACGIRAHHGHSAKERWRTRLSMLLLFALTIGLLVWVIEHP